MFSDKHVIERTDEMKIRQFSEQEVKIIQDASNKIMMLKARQDCITKPQNNN